MAPPKRRTQGGRPVHRGRVTTRESEINVGPGVDPDFVTRAFTRSEAMSHRRAGAEARDPVAPTRRTPDRRPAFRVRPTWHRWLGAGLLVFGAALLVLNDLMMLQPSLLLLPGGHSELYLVAAVLTAGYSTWFFGWFDRTR